jgi:predicted RNA binding protein YcfA (HicA-like mRNA interferase family)
MFVLKMFRADREAGEDCAIDITDNTYLTPGMVYDNTPRGDGSGSRQVAFYLNADANLIQSSPIYNLADTEDGLPYIQYCTQMSLSNDDGRLVDWVDTQYFFFLSLSGTRFGDDVVRKRRQLAASPFLDGAPPSLPMLQQQRDQTRRHLMECFEGFHVVFNVGLSETWAPTASPAPTAPTVSPGPSESWVPTQAPTNDTGWVINPEKPLDFTQETAYRNATDSYGVVAYLCDEDLNSIGETYVRKQGSATVKICVERNAKSVQEGVYLRHIDGFSFVRDQIRQIAVEPVSLPASNGLTELHCQRGSHKCWFETLLMADFFDSPGDVFGSGAASLQFGSASSRRHRIMQREEEDDLGRTKGIKLAIMVTTEEFEVARKKLEGKGQGDKSKNHVYLWVVLVLLVLVGTITPIVCLWRRGHFGDYGNDLTFWKKQVTGGSPSSHGNLKTPEHTNRTRATYLMEDDDSEEGWKKQATKGSHSFRSRATHLTEDDDSEEGWKKQATKGSHSSRSRATHSSRSRATHLREDDDSEEGANEYYMEEDHNTYSDIA